MIGNGDSQQPQQPQQPSGQMPDLGQPIAQLVINLYKTGHVTCSFPENAQAVFQMLAGFLQAVAGRFEIKKQSSIIQLPPGTRVKEPVR